MFQGPGSICPSELLRFTFKSLWYTRQLYPVAPLWVGNAEKAPNLLHTTVQQCCAPQDTGCFLCDHMTTWTTGCSSPASQKRITTYTAHLERRKTFRIWSTLLKEYHICTRKWNGLKLNCLNLTSQCLYSLHALETVLLLIVFPLLF